MGASLEGKNCGTSVLNGALFSILFISQHKKELELKMGNVADSKPQLYSGDMRGRPYVYGGGYMATYKQADPNADTMQYGNTKLQFGVKMIQDTDPGPREGDLYVTDPNGKRLYFTHDNKPYPNAGLIIKNGAGYANGPAVMITGSPLQPQYTMFYSKNADLHGPTNQWTPIPINSKADVLKAMDQGPQLHGQSRSTRKGPPEVAPICPSTEWFTPTEDQGQEAPG